MEFQPREALLSMSLLSGSSAADLSAQHSAVTPLQLPRLSVDGLAKTWHFPVRKQVPVTVWGW